MLKTNSLPPAIASVVCDKKTEPPFTAHDEIEGVPGTYLCRQCGVGLYRSLNQFKANCGWLSFDEEIPRRIKHQMDQDGQRTEIVCARCNAHLGHIFQSEQFTAKNIRH